MCCLFVRRVVRTGQQRMQVNPFATAPTYKMDGAREGRACTVQPLPAAVSSRISAQMGDRRDRDRDRDRDRGPPERINSFFVVDTGFVEPDRNTCFEFQRTGRCTKGDACRFTHAAPPSAQGPHGCVSLVLLYPKAAAAEPRRASRAGRAAARARPPSRGLQPALRRLCGALRCGAVCGARCARACG